MKFEAALLQGEAERRRWCASSHCARKVLTGKATLRHHDSPFSVRACPDPAVRRAVQFLAEPAHGALMTSEHDARVTLAEIALHNLRSLEAHT